MHQTKQHAMAHAEASTQHVWLSIGVVGIEVASAGGWVYSIIPYGKKPKMHHALPQDLRSH